MHYKIGILYPNKTNKGAYEVNQAYLTYFSKFGSLQSIAPYEGVNKSLDAIVLTGGADINPLRYGEYRIGSGAPNVEYDYFSQYILPDYIEANIPIIGVCRGFQDLYVHYGGTLNQHVELPSSTQGSFFTQHNNKGNRGKIVENLKLTQKYNYLQFIPGYTSGVNSLHHQTVNLKTLPSEISPIAYSKEQSNLELFRVKGKNIFGFQGHMEELENTKLFDYLIKTTLDERLENWD